MRVITADGVNDAYEAALHWMKLAGEKADSRNGTVMRARTPVTTAYQKPHQRVLFDSKRDANPYFHLMEALWMLAGRNDVAPMAKYNSTIGQFSDDSVTLNGAYGFRWRGYFDMDQVKWAVRHLHQNPDSRRCVIGMWAPADDNRAVDGGTLDVPCNTQIYFLRRGLNLDMTVTNRSNDIIWGCYGANVVHMSIFHEYVCAMLGMEMGAYYQVSNDWHMYEKHFPLLDHTTSVEDMVYPNSLPLVGQGDYPSADLPMEANQFFDSGGKMHMWRSRFMRNVVQPMEFSWRYHKEGDKAGAHNWANEIKADDWRKACVEWINRRTYK